MIHGKDEIPDGESCTSCPHLRELGSWEERAYYCKKHDAEIYYEDKDEMCILSLGCHRVDYKIPSQEIAMDYDEFLKWNSQQTFSMISIPYYSEDCKNRIYYRTEPAITWHIVYDQDGEELKSYSYYNPVFVDKKDRYNKKYKV